MLIKPTAENRCRCVSTCLNSTNTSTKTQRKSYAASIHASYLLMKFRLTKITPSHLDSLCKPLPPSSCSIIYGTRLIRIFSLTRSFWCHLLDTYPSSKNLGRLNSYVALLLGLCTTACRVIRTREILFNCSLLSAITWSNKSTLSHPLSCIQYSKRSERVIRKQFATCFRLTPAQITK